MKKSKTLFLGIFGKKDLYMFIHCPEEKKLGERQVLDDKNLHAIFDVSRIPKCLISEVRWFYR